MRIKQLKIEGRERNAVIEYAEAGNRVLLTLVDDQGEPTEPTVTLDIHDEDDAWIAAESAHCVLEGYSGTKCDCQEYYELFCRAIY